MNSPGETFKEALVDLERFLLAVQPYAERHAVKEYEDAIEKDWPPAMQEFLARQKRGAEANLERFEALAP